MLRCSSADPIRQRIYQEQKAGLTDKAIVDGIVREEGIVALASPPAEGLGPVITWIMPGIALIVGFFIYSGYVRRNRKEPAPISVQDRAMMDRFRAQIERDLDEQPSPEKDHLSDRR
jgi:cytochrome c-type biogenesis protein CcmH/NrfF